ncbi:MAG: glycosyltransferase family 4 protein [bacterium]|nr:glycosyltransferase family 4 protein [bacterium]
MKVLVFCPYYPPHIGGLETHSDEFNKNLATHGADITVFTSNIPPQELLEEIKYGRVKIIRFPAFEIIPNYPVPKFWDISFWKMLVTLFRSDFDVVLSRTRFFLTSLLALVYAKMKKVLYVHIEHGSGFVQLSSLSKSIIAKAYDHTFGKVIFIFSDVNISISHAVQDFVAKFDKRPSPIIYRGIDFRSIDSIDPDKAIAEKYSDKIIISTAARLYKWKGIENSIAAIQNLPIHVQSKIVFLIMGDGEDYKRLKLLTLHLPIEMMGSIPRERVIAILKASDIYLHSSLPGGGLSTSLLEAMYCECAILATPNEGANEVITSNNGILISEASESRIQQNLVNLIGNDKQRLLYSSNAKKDVSAKFIWENSIHAYEKIFSAPYAQ